MELWIFSVYFQVWQNPKAEREKAAAFADVREIVRLQKAPEVGEVAALRQWIPYIMAACHSSPAHQQVVKDERSPYCPDSRPPRILNHALLQHSYSFPLTRVLSLRSN